MNNRLKQTNKQNGDCQLFQEINKLYTLQQRKSILLRKQRISTFFFTIQTVLTVNTHGYISQLSSGEGNMQAHNVRLSLTAVESVRRNIVKKRAHLPTTLNPSQPRVSVQLAWV